VTSISNALITLATFAAVMLGFLAWQGRAPTIAGVALFAAYCLALIAVVVGFSLAASVLFLRYRDLNQVWDMAVQAGFFIAPVIYPIGILPERFHLLLYAWPPTSVIEFSRLALVQRTSPTATAHLCLAVAVIAAVALGVGVHARLAPRSPEYL
jgi:lipopolysaccharide transport system permease protein